jgi:hypothetical protein
MDAPDLNQFFTVLHGENAPIVARFDHESEALQSRSYYTFILPQPKDFNTPALRAHRFSLKEIQEHLKELHSIKDGWLDGNGLALCADGLNWLSESFKNFFTAGVLLPYLYPTPEGGVQAEWSIQSNEITLEINLTTYEAEWLSLNLDTGDHLAKSLNLNQPESWHWLIKQIQKLDKADLKDWTHQDNSDTSKNNEFYNYALELASR